MGFPHAACLQGLYYATDTMVGPQHSITLHFLMRVDNNNMKMSHECYVKFTVIELWTQEV